MSAPADVLLLRAISHFDRAQLELAVPNAGQQQAQVAAQWIERGIALVKEALENG